MHVFGVPGQYESVALMLSHKMDFNCCANRDGFRKSSHIKLLAFGSMMCIDRFYNHCVQYLVQHCGTQLYL